MVNGHKLRTMGERYLWRDQGGDVRKLLVPLQHVSLPVSPDSPPHAALHGVAASREGVELIGSVTDRVRRTGTAVALTGRSNAEREPPRGGLALDPETWVLLAEEKVLPRVPEIVSGRQMAWESRHSWPIGAKSIRRAEAPL